MPRLYWNLHCGKTARYNWKLFSQQIENNIAFHLMPRSHSAAADWAYAVLGNIDIRMYSCAIMPTHAHMTRVESKTYCRKTGRYIWKLFRQQLENNIDFHLIPRSHSAAADWAYAVLGNIDIRMYSCSIMPTHPHMTRVESNTYCRKTWSLYLKSISSAVRKQYCLSFDTLQPFSRGRLCTWRSWKHRY